MIPTQEQAGELLAQYNKEVFHQRHGAIVSGVLGWFAARHDPEQVEFWKAVGMLHDIDFELYPDEHCVRGVALLEEAGVDHSLIRAAMSHGYGLQATPYQPEHIMEKILFAVDELTGLIGAVALMRPSKSVADLELSSVKKKFKDKKFAAGCSRAVISQGAENLDMELDELISETILAMRSLSAQMEI